MTLKQKIQSLINYANNVTGHDDPDLTTAVQTLGDGYGGGGGEISIDTILKNGYVSVNSNYHKETFTDISSYKCLLVGIFNYESIGYAVIYVDDIVNKNPLNFGIGLNNTYVNLRITTTSIESYFYSGNWQDIKCNIYGYTEDILPNE